MKRFECETCGVAVVDTRPVVPNNLCSICESKPIEVQDFSKADNILGYIQCDMFEQEAL